METNNNDNTEITIINNNIPNRNKRVYPTFNMGDALQSSIHSIVDNPKLRDSLFGPANTNVGIDQLHLTGAFDDQIAMDDCIEGYYGDCGCIMDYDQPIRIRLTQIVRKFKDQSRPLLPSMFKPYTRERPTCEGGVMIKSVFPHHGVISPKMMGPGISPRFNVCMTHPEGSVQSDYDVWAIDQNNKDEE